MFHLFSYSLLISSRKSNRPFFLSVPTALALDNMFDLNYFEDVEKIIIGDIAWLSR